MRWMDHERHRKLFPDFRRTRIRTRIKGQDEEETTTSTTRTVLIIKSNEVEGNYLSIVLYIIINYKDDNMCILSSMGGSNKAVSKVAIIHFDFISNLTQI